MNNERIKQLVNINNAARSYPGEEIKPEASGVIDGKVYSVKYHIVNRECYDNFPTPTALYRIDGKRVSRKVWFAA